MISGVVLRMLENPTRRKPVQKQKVDSDKEQPADGSSPAGGRGRVNLAASMSIFSWSLDWMDPAKAVIYSSCSNIGIKPPIRFY